MALACDREHEEGAADRSGLPAASWRYVLAGMMHWLQCSAEMQSPRLVAPEGKIDGRF
jgi:hypothetical protein